MALGDGGMITRGEQHEAKLYGQLTKAGEFIAADGSVKQQELMKTQTIQISKFDFDN